MCNLYAATKGQQAIRELTRAMLDRTGNLPPLPGVFPDYAAPIVRNTVDGRELANGPMGDALADVRAEGPQQRPRRDECPQYRLPSSAAMAGSRVPVRGAVHQFFGETRRFRTEAIRQSDSLCPRIDRAGWGHIIRRLPVILTSQDEIDVWMEAPEPVALELKRPLPDGALTIVARGAKQDT
jgi:putative SOS response-associated peptidase YedK